MYHSIRGSGYSSKLGHGSVNDEPTPRLVIDLHDYCVMFVACGGHHTIAIVSITGDTPFH